MWDGKIHAMEVTMDASGRLVIPREVRREAGLEPGVPLDIRWREGVIEIEPRPLAVTMGRKGRLLVASPVTEPGRLSTDAVERVRASLRKRDSRSG